MSTTTRVTMPQLGESVHEGTISRWLVKPGDKLVEFEPMLEVDTDKVNAEVPAPVTGVLKESLAQEGETVQAGAEIAVVEVGDGDAAAAEPPAPEAPAEAAEPAAAEAPTTVEASAPVEAPAPVEEAPAAVEETHRYSPAVSMLAEEQGVDLSRVRGSGLGGRVTKRDVRQFGEAQKGGAPGGSQVAPSAPAPAPPGGGDQVVPLTA